MNILLNTLYICNFYEHFIEHSLYLVIFRTFYWTLSISVIFMNILLNTLYICNFYEHFIEHFLYL